MGRPLPPLLASALDVSSAEPALRALVRERSGERKDVREVSAALLRRRVVRYTVQVERLGERGHVTWPVLGKVYESTEAGERGFAALRWLWTQGFVRASPRSVYVPEAYAFVPELRMLLMEEVTGSPLKALLKSEQARPAHLRLCAQALVKLHRFPAAFGAPFTVEDHLATRCAGLTTALASDFPDLAEPIGLIVETARRLATSALTLAHGDYHPGQVHIDGHGLWILDLDPLHRGDPAYDVAMVLLTLKRLESKKRRPEYVRSLADAFLSTYFSHMDLSISERVPLNAALIHLKRACKRFRWQDEERWEDSVRLEIRQGVECLAQPGGQRPLRSLNEVSGLYDRCPT